MSSQSNESALFSTLPQWKMPWSDFVLSYGVQAVIVAILVWIPVLHPEILESPKKDYHAIELVPTPLPLNRTPQRQLLEASCSGRNSVLRPRLCVCRRLSLGPNRKWKTLPLRN